MLFVCMGNICRSPTAEGVFRKLHQDLAPQLNVQIDSAGTHAYHVDQPPDERAIFAARKRGIDISGHRGRVVRRNDFSGFDYILAMDQSNLSRLQRLRPANSKADVRLLLEFAEDCEIKEVPDPYYGGATGFDQVLDLTQQGAMGLLKHLCQRQGINLQITNPSPFGRGVVERVR
ncbi:MAG: low molecular weight protein-tyrosine-phosphatase [Gammaproteobacteria bacterium]